MEIGVAARIKPRLEIIWNALDRNKRTIVIISMPFKRRNEPFSLNKIAIVSLPTILSPCMSSISKNAVLANTIDVDHINTNTEPASIFPDTDKNGNKDVTIPHARAIRMVFEPGISLILLHLTPVYQSGMSLKLYESPIILITRRNKKGINPMV